MSDDLKKLLVAIPTPPRGSMHVDLRAWSTALEVQSWARRFCETAKGHMNDLGDRIKLGEMATLAGTDWLESVLRFLWVDPAQFPSRHEPMLPDNWLAVVQQSGGSPVAENRNNIVKRGLRTPGPEDHRTLVKTNFDAILQIDSDVVPLEGHLRLICEALDRKEVDAVSGIYCMDTPEGPAPIVYKALDRRQNVYDGELLTRPGKDLIKMENGAVPGGFIAVKTYVFEEMVEQDRLWYKDRYADGSIEAYEIKGLLRDHPDPVEFKKAVERFHEQRMREDWGEWGGIGNWGPGEDIWFCRQMQAAGFSLWVDRRIHVQHYKKIDLRRVVVGREVAGRVGFESGLEAAAAGIDDYETWMAARAKEAMDVTEEAKGNIVRLPRQGSKAQEV